MKINKFLKSHSKLFIFLGAIATFSILLASSFFVFPKYIFFNNFFKTPPNLKVLATKIIDECKSVKYRRGCYEKKIPLLMDSPNFLSMDQGFVVMNYIQEKDRSYSYCHLTAHYLSQKEVRKNPDDWKGIITKCPSGSCSNGCVHGVFIERFKTESFNDLELENLSTEVQSVCQKNQYWQPTRSESSGCFHALGHTAMYLSNADINKSLKFCDRAGKITSTDSYFSYSCYQGVFMQVFQPLEQEDRALVSRIRPIKETVPLFCKPYTELAKTACLSESWPLFYSELKDPAKLGDFCRGFEEKRKNYCYSTVVSILTSNSQFNVDFMLNYCSKLTTPKPGTCLGYVALRFLYNNNKYVAQAIDVCQRGAKFDSTGLCHQALMNSKNLFLKNSTTDIPNFCVQFPSEWQLKCLDN